MTMLVSTKGRYALRIMIDLAEHQKDGYTPLKETAARQGISEKYLEGIIKILVKDKMLQRRRCKQCRYKMLAGVRGKGGGYKLTKTPDQYTVGSILRLTEGSLAPVSCLESPEAVSCDRIDSCRTLPMWRGLDKLINNYLDNITLADLVQPDEQWSNYVI